MNTLGDALDQLRNDVLRDVEQPYLWRDEALCSALAQAHMEFAERTFCLRDTTSALTRVALTAGVDLYPLHESIVSVLSARRQGHATDLTRIGHTQVGGEPVVSETAEWLATFVAQDVGPPIAYSTDEGVDGVEGAATLRIFPTPSVDMEGVIVQLRVARLPLVLASVDTLDEKIELPLQFRRALLYGAAAYAYDLRDSDAGDGGTGQKMREKFLAAIAQAQQATRTKMHQPLTWGFGRGGFNHS